MGRPQPWGSRHRTPPLAKSVSPVSQPLAGEARKTTTEAMSPG